MALALPKLRWLVIGAIAAGVWVIRQDISSSRPPERVPTWIERIVGPKPSKPATTTAKADKPVLKPTARAALGRPVPPKPPLAGKSAPPKAVATRLTTKASTSGKIALALPKTVEPPPARPQTIVTGSIGRPDKPNFVQTKARVFMRAQAKPEAPIIATLTPRTMMRELARSGEWRLVMGDGRKGWVHADYLAKPTFLPRRPKLPLAGVHQAKALAGAKLAQ
jgi:hypothetical protein